MMMNIFRIAAFLLFPFCLLAQKKPLEIADLERWRKIEQPQISADGQWVAYLLAPTTEGDNKLCLWNAQKQETMTFGRASEPKFSEDGQYLVFKIKPPLDTLKAQRRRKVKDEELPKDTLCIYTLANGTAQKFPKVKSYALPEKWSGWIAYQLEPEKPAAPKKEADKPATAGEGAEATAKPAESKKKDKKPKKEDAKENGSRLVLRELASGREDTVPFVREYRFAKRGPALLLHSTGRDSGFLAGVYRFNCSKAELQPLFRTEKGKFTQLALDDWGRQAAFLTDTDTSKARIRPWQLCYWMEKQDSARVIADNAGAFLQIPTPPPTPSAAAERGDVEGTAAPRLPSPSGEGSGVGLAPAPGWQLSEHTRPVFSEDGQKLYFGMAPPPVLSDTTLLPEEIVNVEVWAWHNNRLYTEQENRLEADKKRGYPVVFHINKQKFVPLGSPELPEWRFQEQRDANLALAFTEEPYAQNRQWEGAAQKDLYAADIGSGNRQQIVKGLRCTPRISPAAGYILWWSEPDTAWFAWNAAKNTTARLTDNNAVRFYDEENDVPDFPNEHGLAGWLDKDEALLLYDRFDIWRIDPSGKQAPKRLTQGREQKIRYRYLRLNPEERSLAPDARLLLHQFNEATKAEGYAWLDLKTGALTPWLGGDFAYSKSPLKAAKADTLVFTRQNFQIFPDLLYTPLPVNPQSVISSVRNVP